MSTRGARVPTNAPFMITSMLDMFTIILVFLLNFLDPATDALQQVDLPSVEGAAELEAGTVVTLTSSDLYVGGDRILALVGGALPAAEGALEPVRARLEALRAEAARSGEDATRAATLVVQCDRDVPYASVSAVMATAEDAGFGAFRFVVADSTD